jgi:protein TonB
VFVQFIVGTGGYVDIIKTRGSDDLLEKEAQRIISLLPKFKPGILNGKPVRVPFSMPIIFRLQKNL